MRERMTVKNVNIIVILCMPVNTVADQRATSWYDWWVDAGDQYWQLQSPVRQSAVSTRLVLRARQRLLSVYLRTRRNYRRLPRL